MRLALHFSAAAIACLLLSPRVFAEETTASAAASTDSKSTETEWYKQPWGTMGVAHLKSAPFPDDSRKDGYEMRKGRVPYEGHYDDDSVVFAIPKDFKPGHTIDFIVHFHGNNNEARKALGFYQLGEQLLASGKNVIAIIPQGPKNVPEEGIGKIEKPDGFAAMMAEVLETLKKEGKVPRDAKIGNLIISGHSGGYNGIGHVLDHGGMSDDIKEAWLFDAAYGGLDWLAAPFAPPKGGRRLRSFFTDHLTTRNMLIMCKIGITGTRTCMVDEDDITTVGTTADMFARRRFRMPGAKAEVDDFPALLRREPILFVHTHLAHDQVMMGRRYLEKMARESPFLRNVPSKSHNDETGAP